MTYHKLPFPKVICQTTAFKWAKKKTPKSEDWWLTYRLSMYLLTLHWHGNEFVWNQYSDYKLKRFAWHYESFGLLKRFAGKLSHSRLVSLDHFLFFICCNFGIWNPCTTSLQSLISSETRLVCPFLGVLCCCIRWGIRFHAFLATSKKWLFSGFHFLEPLVSGCTC